MKNPYLNDAFFGRLEALSLSLKSDLTGYFGGKHLVRSYGQTVEFADFREYQLGDDIRRIDWNMYSRFEKYFLRLFTDERQMQIQIFIDCSASMGKDMPEKAAYTMATAGALGFLSVESMDKVNFNLMKENESENPFGTLVGKNAFFRAIGALEEQEFDGEVDIEACVKSCMDTGTKNGLTVIISTPDELDPAYDGRVHLIDSEACDLTDNKNIKLRITKSMMNAYQEALRDMKADMKAFCSKHGVDYVTLSTADPIERVLFNELLKAGIMA